MSAWRAVVGYEGLYEVSSDGGVRSIASSSQRGRWNNYAGRELRQATIKRNGYRQVTLLRDGKEKSALVHRLVLEAFVGPSCGLQACHNDGNPANNDIENLRWDTVRANARDRIKHGTSLARFNHPNAKTTPEMVAAVLASDESAVALHKRLGVPRHTVGRIRRGEWK